MTSELKVAIVGGGVSGLSAFWLLNEHSPHDVHLFEKRDYMGGDAHSITYQTGEKGAVKECQVETAFVQFHHVGWPNLHRFFHHAGVALDKADGSTSFTRRSDESQYTWGSLSLWTFFGANIAHFFTPRKWRLLFDIFRFNHQAIAAIGDQDEQLLGEFLEQQQYSPEFQKDYLFPLMAAVLSIPCHTVRGVPLANLARIMHNMCLLQLWGKPDWECVKGGSVSYINRIISGTPGQVHTNTEVTKLERTAHGWRVHTKAKVEEYDRVILTGPPRGIRKVLGQSGLVSPLANEVLGAFSYSDLEIVVHEDESFLPPQPFHAGWNVVMDESVDEKGAPRPVEITFDVNRLQHYPQDEFGLILETQDPARPIDSSKVHSEYAYTHPIHDLARYRALRKVPALRHELAAHDIGIAGAWMGYGVHESGWRAGIEAAMSLGGEMPFPLVSSDRPVVVVWWDFVMVYLLKLLSFFL